MIANVSCGMFLRLHMTYSPSDTVILHARSLQIFSSRALQGALMQICLLSTHGRRT